MAQELTSQGLRTLLLTELTQQPRLRRKALIERCVAKLDFTPQQLEQRNVDAEVIRTKNRLGMQLTALIQNGDIAESEAGHLTVERSAGTLQQRDRLSALIQSLLADSKVLSRRQIYAAAAQRLQPETPQKERDLRSVLGQTINAMERERRLLRTSRGYVLPLCDGYPNTELGNWLSEARRGDDLCRCFLGAVHTKGGEWLESYAVRLMEKYDLRQGKTVTAANVTGGSDDGGLDGVVETTDALGFREVTLLQMKNRHCEITAKDVREFYGAVCAAGGTRGIFITVSTFHSEARKLLDKVDNLIGIDGKLLFRIAADCGYGVIQTPQGLRLDDSLFLGDMDEPAHQEPTPQS